MKINILVGIGLFIILVIGSLRYETAEASSFSDYVNARDPITNSALNKNSAATPAVSTNSDDGENPPTTPGIPAKWRSCSQDSDCTAGVADCVTWEALNKTYLHQLSKRLASCSTAIDPGFQPQADCENKTCAITEQTTNVSWEEWLTQIRSKS